MKNVIQILYIQDLVRLVCLVKDNILQMIAVLAYKKYQISLINYWIKN